MALLGSHLTSLLEAQGHQLLLATRGDIQVTSATVSIGDIDTFDNWEARLSGIDTVIHLAACVHQMNEQSDQAALNYQRINVDATVRLAKTAIECGVKRFVFLSSIKVNIDPGCQLTTRNLFYMLSRARIGLWRRKNTPKRKCRQLSNMPNRRAGVLSYLKGGVMLGA